MTMRKVNTGELVSMALLSAILLIGQVGISGGMYLWGWSVVVRLPVHMEYSGADCPVK